MLFITESDVKRVVDRGGGYGAELPFGVEDTQFPSPPAGERVG